MSACRVPVVCPGPNFLSQKLMQQILPGFDGGHTEASVIHGESDDHCTRTVEFP